MNLIGIDRDFIYYKSIYTSKTNTSMYKKWE